MKKRFYIICNEEEFQILGPNSLLGEHYINLPYNNIVAGYILPFDYSEIDNYINNYICLEYEEIFSLLNPQEE